MSNIQRGRGQDAELAVIKSNHPPSSDESSRNQNAEMFGTLGGAHESSMGSFEQEDEDCECNHDFYNQVLGPTADEAILSGLNSIKGFVERLLKCGGDGNQMNQDSPKCACEAEGNKCLNANCQTESCKVVDCGVTSKPTYKNCCVCCQTENNNPSRSIDDKAVCCHMKNLKSRICKCCKPSRCSMEKNKDKTCGCMRTEKTAAKCCKPCNSGCKGDQAEECCPCKVKYAITKINQFKDFTTYEVMRSTHRTPRKMPKCVEGVFVLKQKTCR